MKKGKETDGNIWISRYNRVWTAKAKDKEWLSKAKVKQSHYRSGQALRVP